MRWGDDPELSRWAQSNQTSPYKWRIFPSEVMRESCDDRIAVRASNIAGFEDGGGATSQEMPVASGAGKGKEADSPAEGPQP